MSACARPLDPMDAEALASGSDPVIAADAADHARLCPSCAASVSEAARLARDLDALATAPASATGEDPAKGADLAIRVTRIRPFSRRELTDFSLWRGACLFSAGLFFTGLLLLLLPGVTAREQTGLAVAALAPAAALLRAAVRSLGELAAASPAGLEALAQALRGESALGLACLLLLGPALWGFSRALVRRRAR
jgi:hypothetical protein